MNSDYSPEVKEKTSKSLLWIGIISIIMFFAGLTSAYLVIRLDNFWVNLGMPREFWVSSVLILISSLTIHLAISSAKKGNKSKIKLFLVLTLVLGLGFSVCQFYGWKTLFKSGNALVGDIVPPGKYGKYITVKYNGTTIRHENSKYYLGDKEIAKGDKERINAFCKAIYETNISHSDVNYPLDDFREFELIYHNGKTLEYKNNQFYVGKHPLIIKQRIELKQSVENILNERGDFFMKGEYGKDFSISYKGEKLRYESGKLFTARGELNKAEYGDLNAMANRASSFLYLLTALHLLHLFGGLIYIIVLVVRAFNDRFDAENHLSIKLGSIYWHFMDALWIYLFLFLFLIH